MSKIKVLSLILLIAAIAVISGCTRNLTRNQGNNEPVKVINIATSSEPVVATSTIEDITAEAAKVATSTKNWRTYKNIKYKYEIKFPKNFISVTEYDGIEIPIENDIKYLEVGSNIDGRHILINVESRYRKTANGEITDRMDILKNKDFVNNWRDNKLNDLSITEVPINPVGSGVRDFIITNRNPYISLRISSNNNDIDDFALKVLSSFKLLD